jgi:hypothetical protein
VIAACTRASLYAKIVSLGWHPFMRINKQGKFRPQGEGKFRSLATAAPEVGRAWCGKVDCFSGELSRLQCTLLARWDQGYEEGWLIVTDLAPAEATAVWYGMRSWIEGGFKDTKRGGWGWHQTKEEYQNQSSCVSGGGLLKNLPVKDSVDE